MAAPKAGALNPAPSANSSGKETLGGGTVWTPAIGPAPSFGLGGSGMVLVKNWDFGTNGTIRNYADMSENFLYHDQFGTINNGGKYGANMVSPDFANSVGGQPIEGENSPPVRSFTADSLVTILTPLDNVKDVQVRNHNTGNGSFVGKWRLPNGGSLLGRDIVWETRVRFVPPPYFWFALYGLDWDRQGRLAAIEVVDAASGNLLDSHEISAYAGGKYLIWNIRGHVILRVRKFGDWTNSAMSGLFFDPVAGSKVGK